MKTALLIMIMAILPNIGCAKSGGYRPVTYMLWANELRENSSNLIEITSLTDSEIDMLKSQNPHARFYWTASGKRVMKPDVKPNYKGFFEKVYLTPVTIVIDGVCLRFLLF